VYTDNLSYLASAELTASGLVDAKVTAISLGVTFQIGWAGPEFILARSTAPPCGNFTVAVFRAGDAAKLWSWVGPSTNASGTRNADYLHRVGRRKRRRCNRRPVL
jgi:hypothetical protein